MKTVSAYVTAPERFEFVEEELPELGEYDVLLKTEAVGLCHTDLPVFLCQQAFGLSEHGYRKTVTIDSGSKLGHEPVGTIVQVGGKVTRFAVGDHVTGFYSHAFTTYRVLPEDTVLVKIPELQPGRDWRTCVVEPMGCVTNILHYMEQDPLEYVGVVGCGYMNLMVLAALRDRGMEAVLTDGDNTVRVLRDESASVPDEGGYFSLITAGTCRVTIRGAKYPLERAVLDRAHPSYGVSNEVTDGEAAVIVEGEAFLITSRR